MAVLPDVLTANVAAGAPAVMVTEYMPGGDGAQIINPATSGTIYVGTSSGVGSSNGVPVPAGASVQWTQSGQLWAVAGPDFPSGQTTTLIVSQCINQWTPSPEAVASATADQLLTQGIPQVFRGQLLYSGSAAEFPTLGMDVSQYASLNVNVTPDGAPGVVGYQFSDPESGAVLDENYLIDCDQTYDFTARIPVSGPLLYITSMFGTPSVTIYGSNRTVPAIAVNQPNQTKQYQNQGNITAAGSYTLVDEQGISKSVFDGPVMAQVIVNGSGASGEFFFNFRNSAGGTFAPLVFDTSQMHARVTGAPSGLTGTFTFNHPRGAGYWTYNNRATSGTFNVFLVLTGS